MEYDPEILQDFLTESGELLDELDADLVSLEDNADDQDMLNKVFRALHTIKGSASFLGMTNLVRIAHVAEDALNAARKGNVQIDQLFMDSVLDAVDILKRQFEQVEAGDAIEEPPAVLVETLIKIGTGSSPAAVSAGEGAVSANAIDAPASAASCEPDSASRPAGAAAEIPLDLPESKAVLVEFMAADITASLDDLRDVLAALLQDHNELSDKAPRVSDFVDGISSTLSFFDLPALSVLVDALDVVHEALPEFDADRFAEIFPWIDAVITVLREQLAAMCRGVLLELPADQFSGALVDLVLGHDLPAEAQLPENASAQDALWVYGVSFGGSAADDAATEPANAAPAFVEAAPDSPQAGAVAGPSADAADASQTSSPGEPEPPARAAARSVEQTIRVEVGRLESLLNLVGELVLQKNRVGALARSLEQAADLSTDLRESVGVASSDLDRVTSDIQTAVMRTRMQPLDKLFGKYPRLVRDLARKTSKDIQLVIEGGDTEVDKSVIEELGDPVVHILRNSADHGVETPEERTAAGKPARGTIKIDAEHQGSHVVVRIADDGRGLYRDKILEKAIKRGMTTAEEAKTLSDSEVFRFILGAGFSTAAQVSDLSGRGVGMDVVRTNIEKLKGTLDIESEPGAGTAVVIKIPLTVAIMPAMMVGVAEELYAVPLTNIVEIVRPEENDLNTVRGRRVIRLRDEVLPLVSVSELFSVPDCKENEERFAVVVELNELRAGLLVTRLVGQQEVVVKPLEEALTGGGAISGATVRDDGGVSLIVDVARMINVSKTMSAAGDAAAAQEAAAA